MAAAPKQGSSVDYRKVQRPIDELPVLHLESDIPSPAKWEVVIDGMVASPSAWDVEDIKLMPAEGRAWDLNCVWGWVRPGCRWEGVPASRLIDIARPAPGATYAVVSAAPAGPDAKPYASCLSIADARKSLLAWMLDDQELTAEHGGPLRLIAPPNMWGYKGVKWVAKLTLIDHFAPGFWEEMVGNPEGLIPPELQENRFE